MQRVRFYDERDSTSAARVTVSGERQPSEVFSSIVDGGRVDHKTSQTTIHYWSDAERCEAHLMILDGTNQGAPSKQLSVSYPCSAMSMRVLSSPVDPNQLIVVWVSSHPVVYVSRFTVFRTNNGCELSVNYENKDTIASTPSCARSCAAAATVLPVLPHHGILASVLITDGDTVWCCDVQPSADVEESVWLAGHRDNQPKVSRGWLGGSYASEEVEISPIRGIDSNVDGQVFVVLEDGSCSQFNVNGATLCNESKVQGLDKVASALCGENGHLIVVGTTRRNNMAVKHSVTSGTTQPLVAPDANAVLRSYTAGPAGESHVLWAVPEALELPPVNVGSLCTRSDAADEFGGGFAILQLIPAADDEEMQPRSFYLPSLDAYRAAPHLDATTVLFGTVVNQQQVFADVMHQPSAVEELFAKPLGSNYAMSGTLLSAAVAVELENSFGDDSDANLPHAVRSGLDVICTVENGFALLNELIQEAAVAGSSTTQLRGFSQLRAAADWADIIGVNGLVTPQDVDDAIQFALTVDDMPIFCATTRRFVFNRALQSFVARIATLVLAHTGWICSGTSDFIHSPVLEKMSMAFQLLAGSFRASAMLGSSLPSSLNLDNSQSLHIGIMEYFLQIDLGAPDLVVTIFTIANDLMEIGTPQAARSCSAWVSIWRKRFPVLQYHDAVAFTVHGKTSGATSSLIQSYSRAAASHLASLDKDHQTQILTQVIGSCGDMASAPQVDMMELLNTHNGYAPQLLRVCLMRKLIVRVDVPIATSFISRAALEPSFTSDLSILRQTVADEFEGDLQQLDEFLRSLTQDTTLFLLRGALDDCNYGEVIRLLGLILETEGSTSSSQIGPQILKFHTQSLVLSAFLNGRTKELISLRFNNPQLVNIVVGEMYHHVVNPRSNQSQDKKERERRRVENAMALYKFLATRHAYGAAARVVYEVGVALRSAPQCTTETLTHALNMLSLAVSTVRMIPDVVPPRGVYDDEDVFGNEQSTAGALFSEASIQIVRHYNSISPCTASALPIIERQMLQTSCERKLMVRLERPMDCNHWSGDEDSSGAKAVVRELLSCRMWRDALELAKAWELPHESGVGLVVETYSRDMIAYGESNECTWADFLSLVRGESTVENNYRYEKDALCVMLNSKHYRLIPVELKQGLICKDPSGYVACSLQQHGQDNITNIKESVVQDALTVGRNYLKAKSSGKSLKDNGFENDNVYISPGALDRLIDMARKVYDRHQKSEKQGVGSSTFNAAKEILTLTKQRI